MLTPKPKEIILRKILAILGAATILLSLTACAPSNPADALTAGTKVVCDGRFDGPNAAKIEMSDDLKVKPEAKFPTPLTSKKVETKVIKEGTGIKFTGGQLIEMEYQIYNAGTGAFIQGSNFDGTNPATQFSKVGDHPDFCNALSGVREGSRVAMLFPPTYAHNNAGIPEMNVGVTDALIFVFDLKKVFLHQAVGDDQLPQSGMPNVVITPEGLPGITIPKTAAPTETRVSTLVQGRGEVVKADDVVTINYAGFVWDTGVKFESSWDNGEPTQFQASVGQLIPGFLKSLVGQKIGSRVLAVIPPEEAYGNQDQGLIPANSTLIFVIEILGVETPNK